MDEFQHKILPLKNKLFRFALSVVANKELAEDLVQDAYVKLWKSRKQLAEVRNLEAWTMRMVKNLCIDHFRGARSYVGIVADGIDMMDKGAAPDKVTEQKNEMELLEAIMNRLPEQQRMVFQLREVEAYSYKEIAEILEISMDSVKVNIHRARKFMRTELEKVVNYGL